MCKVLLVFSKNLYIDPMTPNVLTSTHSCTDAAQCLHMHTLNSSGNALYSVAVLRFPVPPLRK